MVDFTRPALYELVWTTPASALAKQYAISDVGLSKLCRREAIPRPPRGYWAKLRADKKVERTPREPTKADHRIVASLPLRSELGQTAIPPTAAEQQEADCSVPETPQAVRFPELGPPPTFPDDIEEHRERWATMIRRVPRPALGPQRHPAIDKTLREDEARRVRRHEDFWRRAEGPRFRSPLQQRRLRMLNAIFLALEAAGARCEFEDNTTWQCQADVAGTVTPFFLHAPSAFRRGQKVNESPTQLELRVGTAATIRDAKGVWNERRESLDRQLIDMVAGILTAAELLRRENAVKAYGVAVRQREWALEEERRRRMLQERARRKVLAEEAEAHQTAESIRALVATVRATGQFRGERLPAYELEEWAQWALSAATRLDPITSDVATRSTSLRPDRWGEW